MTSQEIETLVGAVETRNKKHYDWIRSLVLLASGALAVVVSLHSDKQLAVMPLFYMKAAWVSLGLGILLGSVSLHGDVWTSAETAQRLARALSEPHPRNITVHVKLPFRYRASTSLCYLSLSCAVISFVLYALTRWKCRRSLFNRMKQTAVGLGFDGHGFQTAVAAITSALPAAVAHRWS